MTSRPDAAARYAGASEDFRRDRWTVLLHIDGAQTTGDAFKEIGRLVQAFQHLARKKLIPPLASESEWIFRAGRALRHVKTRRDPKRRLLEVTLAPTRSATGAD